MLIDKNPSITKFTGIRIKDGGINYVRNEGGETAVNILHDAVNTFADSKWDLNIGEEGYSLTSPTTFKTYHGPFTVKKLLKTGWRRNDASKIVIRMDKNNRVKYPIDLESIFDVRNIYSRVKNSKGIKRMLLLLSLLEGHHPIL